MDQLTEKKKKLEEVIVDTMIKAVEAEELTEEEMSKIAQFVLDGIDGASDQVSLKAFLHELAGKWKLFKPMVILEEAEEQEKVEEEVAQGVLVLLEHGKIDNAIKLAQSVTHTKEEKPPKDLN